MALFETWLKRTVLERRLKQRMDDRDEEMLASTFTLWRQGAVVVGMARRVGQRRDGMVVRRCWDQWRLQTMSKSHDSRRILRMGLRVMKARKAKREELEAAAKRFRNRSLLQCAMSKWIQQERCGLYRRVRDVRAAERVMKNWNERLATVRRNEDVAIGHHDGSIRAHLARCFTAWRVKAQTRRGAVQRAIQMHDSAVKLRAFGQWRSASQIVLVNSRRADKAAAYFRQREVLAVWRGVLEKRRLAKAAELARSRVLKDCFRVWRDATERQRRLQGQLEEFEQEQSKVIMKRTLNHWAGRVVGIKSKEREAVAQGRRKLKRDTMARWKAALARVRSRKILLASALEVRDEDLARRVIRLWSEQAVRARDLRTRAERSALEQSDRIIMNAFATWRGRLKERRLEPMARRVEEIVEDGLMFAVWDRWVVKSTNLPLIAFTKRRVLKAAISKWRQALETRQMEKSVMVPQEQRLLSGSTRVQY
ncbi:Sfi1 spindle body [Kockovaella imperatae]|uniref:Sfi1 spindle body n=1 Tax=Kockovaella imperatae TaxID=4999 RepID=A0A1Y1URG6_9TREE|nr:Sfi1 spindle body [Kockovaella imperatae]ORX40653.1 Sfi1 spindle body [Kockovaella imperatae]